MSKGRTKIWPYILDPGPIYAEGQNFRDRPRASRFIFNTYRGWSSFILNSSNETIPCREGIVQGDSLSMFIYYAIATIPFIRELESTTSATQLWYADIFAALGDHPSLRFWFDRLQEVVPYLVTSLSMVRAAWLSMRVQLMMQQIYCDSGVKVSLAADSLVVLLVMHLVRIALCQWKQPSGRVMWES